MKNIIQQAQLWDENFSLLISESAEKSRKIKFLATFLAKSGDHTWWMIACLLCFLLNIVFPRLVILIHLVGIAVSAIFTQLIKLSFRRKRPDGDYKKFAGNFDKYSFPSGHASRMGCLTILMIFFFPKFGWFFILWSILVCYGRIAVSVHYFFDILGGFILGAIVGLVFYFTLVNPLTTVFTPFINWVASGLP